VVRGQVDTEDDDGYDAETESVNNEIVTVSSATRQRVDVLPQLADMAGLGRPTLCPAVQRLKR